METLRSLMFELANEDRLRILILLQQESMRLTQVSEKLALNMQETSRHLSRLSEAGLVFKDEESLFSVRPFGREILSLMNGFEFLSKHRDYFNAHDLMILPLGFRNRIGELKNCTLGSDVFTSLHLAENVIRGAEEYLWMMSDQILASTKPLIDEVLKKRKTRLRYVFLDEFVAPPGLEPLPWLATRMEERILGQIDVAMVISEKEAQVAFRGKDGKMDFRAFTVVEHHALNWCKELYEYYWKRATTGRPKGWPEK